MRKHAFTNTVIAAARFETADETIKKRAIDDLPYELMEVPTKAVPYKAAAGALKSGSFPVFFSRCDTGHLQLRAGTASIRY